MNTTTDTDFRHNIARHQALVDEMSSTFNESTGATWLWAALFGPLYFLVHGMWVNIVLSLVATLALALVAVGAGDAALVIVVLGGAVIDILLAYREWKRRAIRKATNMATLGFGPGNPR